MSLADFLRSRFSSFVYATAGVADLVRSQPNAWIHVLATACTVGLAAWLGLPARDWALLFAAIGLVFCAEALNTALEALADEVSAEQRPGIGRAKDAAAGGVLLAALAAAAIGFCVLGPPLWAALR
ncbi:MAG: diacylglycerol kinase family protein [Myxococcota bacterium]|nr:diacylglycerol kinase family protein [Myxococcota bacterium]